MEVLTRACKLCLLLCGFQFAQLIVHYLESKNRCFRAPARETSVSVIFYDKIITEERDITRAKAERICEKCATKLRHIWM